MKFVFLPKKNLWINAAHLITIERSTDEKWALIFSDRSPLTIEATDYEVLIAAINT